MVESKSEYNELARVPESSLIRHSLSVLMCCLILFPGSVCSSMEPERRTKALEAERYGKRGHGAGFYHRGS